MAPSCCIDLSTTERQLLLDIANQSIADGLNGKKKPLAIDIDQQSDSLAKPAASFVTLTKNESLRGCMGNLKANEALAQSVAHTAYNAAFKDPRFPALSKLEWHQTDLEISVLSAMQPIPAINREQLLNELQVGVDGLILEDGRHRSTFLPKVWQSLNNPDDFLRQLFLKAGLPANYWSDSMRFHRYQTESIHDPMAD